jgi:hypothetical protein
MARTFRAKCKTYGFAGRLWREGEKAIEGIDFPEGDNPPEYFELLDAGVKPTEPEQKKIPLPLAESDPDGVLEPKTSQPAKPQEYKKNYGKHK